MGIICSYFLLGIAIVADTYWISIYLNYALFCSCIINIFACIRNYFAYILNKIKNIYGFKNCHWWKFGLEKMIQRNLKSPKTYNVLKKYIIELSEKFNK